MMNRIGAIACRCQLLVGSYDRATRVCECEDLDRCELSPEELTYFRNHPKVIEARKRNMVESQQLTTTNITSTTNTDSTRPTT